MINYESFVQQLLDGYKTNYDIDIKEGATNGLVAVLHMHASQGQHLIFKEVKMWEADADEYVYVFRVPSINKESAEQLIKEAYDDGFPKINLEHLSFSHQHMCTRLVAIFLCDEATDDALKIIKKCRIYKSFQFSFKGWMEMHTACVNLSDGSIVANRYGRETAKFLKMHVDHYNKHTK